MKGKEEEGEGREGEGREGEQGEEGGGGKCEILKHPVALITNLFIIHVDKHREAREMITLAAYQYQGGVRTLASQIPIQIGNIHSKVRGHIIGEDTLVEIEEVAYKLNF